MLGLKDATTFLIIEERRHFCIVGEKKKDSAAVPNESRPAIKSKSIKFCYATSRPV